MSYITVLTGKLSAVKHYTINNGVPQKGQVIPGKVFDSQTETVHNLQELYQLILRVAEDPHKFIIRGKGVHFNQFNVQRTIHEPKNFIEVPSDWVCIDFDNAETPYDRTSIEAIDFLIQERLPPEFHNRSYILQWSGSAGLEYNGKPIKAGTNAHLFFYLDSALSVKHFKHWLDRDKVDYATLNTVTPIFVCPLVEKDSRIDDIIDGPKIQIIKKEKELVSIPASIRFWTPPVYNPVTIDVNTSDAILQKLKEVNCIIKEERKLYRVYHPGEKTQGDWFLYKDNLKVVHHHKGINLTIFEWLKKFWGVDFSLGKKTNVSSTIEELKKQREDEIDTLKKQIAQLRSKNDKQDN